MAEIFTTVCSRCSVMFSILLLIPLLPNGWAINCYNCSSRNQSDKNCNDPYHPANSLYTEDCKVGKKGHIGVFPANFCLKITGETEATGEQLVIRTCIMENMDNQCGVFRYEDVSFKGCILTCDYDGCNTGIHSISLAQWTIYSVTTMSVLLLFTSIR